MSTIKIKCHKDCRPNIIINNYDCCESESESESEPPSESETKCDNLDDPKPYHGKGFRVYFDSHEDKRFFMQAFGFK